MLSHLKIYLSLESNHFIYDQEASEVCFLDWWFICIVEDEDEIKMKSSLIFHVHALVRLVSQIFILLSFQFCKKKFYKPWKSTYTIYLTSSFTSFELKLKSWRKDNAKSNFTTSTWNLQKTILMISKLIRLSLLLDAICATLRINFWALIEKLSNKNKFY